jgi:ABC-type multidrug transport system permease subunit
MSMRVTAKCRYNAAVRLQWQGKFAFFTTTVLSLGLIFIPLIQTAGVELAFGASFLNMMQIFLAVAILVYSVVIRTARYDVREETLTECGDKL